MVQNAKTPECPEFFIKNICCELHSLKDVNKIIKVSKISVK